MTFLYIPHVKYDVYSHVSGQTCYETCVGGGSSSGSGSSSGGGIGIPGSGTGASVWTVGNFIFKRKPDGIIHVNIDPISWQTSSDFAKLQQIASVINAMRLLFCETNEYEAIDWRDYFTDISGSGRYATTVMFPELDPPCSAAFDLSFAMYPNYIMDTEPCTFPGSSGNMIVYSWCYANTNIPMLTISIEQGCGTMFDDYLLSPPCP